MSDSKYVFIMEMIDSGYVNTEDLSIQYCLYRLLASLLSYLCNEERYDNWISILNDLSISYSYFISDGFDLYTLPGQKCWNTTKYSCTDSAIYRLNIQFGAKMGIEICRDKKFNVLALTLVKIFDFLTFHRVLIY